MKKVVVFLLGIAVCFPVTAVPTRLYAGADTAAMNRWVESVMRTLSVPERIGQLFVAGVETKMTDANRATIKEYIEHCHVGGLLFFAGTPEDQLALTLEAQSAARVPLLITLDGEWGLAMRLSGTPVFPRNMTLGAVQNDSLIYAYGREMGRACRRMGIQVNFAPVLDVNSNPLNPVIGIRSFGENPEEVARRAIAYAAGLEDEGVMAVGKHFPGHGDTHEDSHQTLPLVARTREQFDTCDLYPFRRSIEAGLSGIMVAHLRVPAFDSASRPSSLSPVIVSDLLQKELGFEGLVFTDALAMKGAVSTTPSLDALRAGNDVLLDPLHLQREYDSLVEAYNNGELSEEVIDAHCRKILRYKYLLGLNHYKPVSVEGLRQDLNTLEARKLIRQLSAQAVTVVQNRDDRLPFTHLDRGGFGVVVVGKNDANAFLTRLREYVPLTYVVRLNAETDDKEIAEVYRTIGKSRAIVAVFSNGAKEVQMAQNVLADADKTLVFFTSPYRAERYRKLIRQSDAVVFAYEGYDVMQECAAETLFGGNAASGRLPVSVGNLFRQGDGIDMEVSRLGHAFPEEVGMDSRTLSRIDSIVREGIDSMAFPGCQILVSHHKKIVYERAFGYFDYEKTHAVRLDDLYDLASITKVMATLPAIMWLNDHEQVRLAAPLGFYLPELREHGLSAITLRQTLMHESGLPATIPLRRLLLDPDSYPSPLLKQHRDSEYRIQVDRNWYAYKDCRLKPWLVNDTETSDFSLPVTNKLYADKHLPDTIWQAILSVNRMKEPVYKYSDLNFIILQKLTERISGEGLDHFIEKRLLRPIGAYRTTFRPTLKFDSTRIAPTEYDAFLRHQLIDGYPHDELACFMGGVSGNAGLFSNARDLAKILQMLQDKGSYGNEEYLEPTTVQLFVTTKSTRSRRGLGFDKPDTGHPNRSPTCQEAPASVYGHTGYTGTAFWVDPDNDLIYIFLCNRVYPHRWNTRLLDMNIRTRIQSVIYQSLCPDTAHFSEKISE